MWTHPFGEARSKLFSCWRLTSILGLQKAIHVESIIFLPGWRAASVFCGIDAFICKKVQAISDIRSTNESHCGHSFDL